MPTRLTTMTIDAAEPDSLARFWAQLLGREVTDGVALAFEPTAEPKVTKNRIHLDLVSSSLIEQAAQVELALRLGATHLDIGQGNAAWVVMADPEGNEFCVLEPREVYLDTGPVAAIVVDCVDRAAMAAFWTAAAGWPVQYSKDYLVALRSPGGEGSYLELLAVGEPKKARNRVRLAVAPGAGDNQRAEAARLTEFGASLVDAGQAGGSLVEMTDPEGNEFSLLAPV